MLTKPRTVCACQPVAAIISASVAPLARFIIAMTSAFLFVPSDFGLATVFFTWGRLLCGLGFLGGLAPSLGLRLVRGLADVLGIDCAHLLFSFDRSAVVTLITRAGRNSKANLGRLRG
jgi:hypothetical protein